MISKSKSNRGGAGRGQGRKKTQREDGSIGKGFATKVMAQMKTMGLAGVASPEDYALAILKRDDAEAHSFFRYLLDRRYGKPAQSVIQRDNREDVPDVEFGDLPMPAGPQPGKAGKPN